MKIEISNPVVEPSYYSKGTSRCNIQYQGKGLEGDRQVNVNYLLSGSNDIWFIENGIETKKIGPKNHTFLSSGSDILEVLTIKVKESHPAKIAFIKIQAIDQEGYQVSKNKGITYG